MRSKWMIWSLIGALTVGMVPLAQAGGGQGRNQERNRAAQEGAGGQGRGNLTRERLRDGTGPGCQDGSGGVQPRQGLQRQRQGQGPLHQRQGPRDGTGPGCTAEAPEE